MIVGNTTVSRPAGLRDRQSAQAGGLSGRPLLPLADRMLAETYVRVEGVFPLVGAGGIDSGASALGKIRAGASLIQIYSGLVFRGLGLIGEIKTALLAELDRDDSQTIADSVGADGRSKRAVSIDCGRQCRRSWRVRRADDAARRGDRVEQRGTL